MFWDHLGDIRCRPQAVYLEVPHILSVCLEIVEFGFDPFG